jgi:hypothetical protein
MEEIALGNIAVSQVIQLILAPSVMVTASAVLLNGILGRFAAINDRLRVITRERFEVLLELRTPDPLLDKRMHIIDAQYPDLLARLRLEHDASVQMYLAIVIFMADMLLIALTTIASAGWLGVFALFAFLAGVGTMLSSVLMVVRELRLSLTALQYEVQHIMTLKPESGAAHAPKHG